MFLMLQHNMLNTSKEIFNDLSELYMFHLMKTLKFNLTSRVNTKDIKIPVNIVLYILAYYYVIYS